MCLDGPIELPTIFENKTLGSEGAERAEKGEILVRMTKEFD